MPMSHSHMFYRQCLGGQWCVMARVEDAVVIYHRCINITHATELVTQLKERFTEEGWDGFCELKETIKLGETEVIQNSVEDLEQGWWI